MGKYDDEAVDELIEHVKAMLTPFPINKIKQGNDTQWDPTGYSNYTEAKSKAEAVIKRLQPKPEMEHVLKEFRVCRVVKTDEDTDFIEVGGFYFSEKGWNSLREDTRVPVKPKQEHVPAGEDWSEDDLEKLRMSFYSNSPKNHKDTKSLIDHIKQKCGV